MLETLKTASCGLSVALKRTGCDVWQLECQASSVTASVQVTTFCVYACFQSFSTPISRTRIVHRVVLKFSPCRNKQLPKPQHVHINTHAPPVACPRRSTRAMQIIIGSTKQCTFSKELKLQYNSCYLLSSEIM